MSEILLPYQLELTTASPLHIGTGNKLGSGDCILQGNKVIVLDEKKLIEWIAEKEDSERIASDLADYMGKPNGMREFVQRYNVPLQKVQAYGIEKRTSGQIREINEYIKTMENKPYIPASSIKGSLRSSLLRGVLLNDQSKRNGFARDVSNHINNIRGNNIHFDHLERRVFLSRSDIPPRKYSNYDLHRCLVIRDSSAFPIEKMYVAEVKVMSTRSTSSNLTTLEFKDKIHIYAEVIAENAKTAFSLVWQTYLLSGLNAANELGFDQINDYLLFLPWYCRLASENLLRQEIDFCRNHGKRRLAQWFESTYEKLRSAPQDTFLLPLGWGSGYDAKTVTDLLGEDKFRVVVDRCRNTRRLGKPGGSEVWLGVENSPKSRKVVVENNGEKPLGWVWLTLKPLDGGENWIDQERQKKMNKAPQVEWRQTKAASSAAQSAAPAAPRPDASSKPAEKPKAPERSASKPIIPKFNDLPQVGDVFYGKVFDKNNEAIFLVIPGLDADEVYGLLPLAKLPKGSSYKVGGKVLCEVVNIRKEKHEMIVDCEPYGS